MNSVPDLSSSRRKTDLVPAARPGRRKPHFVRCRPHSPSSQGREHLDSLVPVVQLHEGVEKGHGESLEDSLSAGWTLA